MKMGTIAATIAGSIANGGGIVVVNADGGVSVTPASGTGLLLGVAPPATNRYALVQIGNGPVDGVTAGHYVGSASGGGYGANFVSGYAGDLLNLQVAGVSKASISASGVLACTELDPAQWIRGGFGWLTAGIAFAAPTGTQWGAFVQPGSTTAPVFVARAATGSSADIAQFQTSGGTSSPTSAAALAGIRADGLVYSTAAGLATNVKAGAPTDADWTVAPPDGTTKGDSTNSKFWIRLGGVWKGVVVA